MLLVCPGMLDRQLRNPYPGSQRIRAIQLAEIRQQLPNEFVLIEVTKTDDDNVEILAGNVSAHAPNREEIMEVLGRGLARAIWPSNSAAQSMRHAWLHCEVVGPASGGWVAREGKTSFWRKSNYTINSDIL
jgi:hypothetical protein